MTAKVTIRSLHDFSYDENNGNWNGNGTVGISTLRGSVEINVPFRKCRDLREAQIEILQAIQSWASDIQSAAHEAEHKIPPNP